MLILFEGPDGSGKTTLINRLKTKHFTEALVCKRNSFKTYDPEKSNYPANINLTESAFYDWRFFLEMHAANFGSHMFLCDRSFITQSVYQNATGPETRTPELDATLAAYAKEVEKVPHLVVYCKRDTLRNDNDLWFINGKEKEIIAEYDTYMQSSILNTLYLDTKLLDEDACTALILGASQAAYSHYLNNNNEARLQLWTYGND